MIFFSLRQSQPSPCKRRCRITTCQWSWESLTEKGMAINGSSSFSLCQLQKSSKHQQCFLVLQHFPNVTWAFEGLSVDQSQQKHREYLASWLHQDWLAYGKLWCFGDHKCECTSRVIWALLHACLFVCRAGLLSHALPYVPFWDKYKNMGIMFKEL